MTRHEDTFWTIDGSPVQMDEVVTPWSASMVAPGGYDIFTGRCTTKGLPWIGQGSIVTGYYAGHNVFWQGELSQPPKLAFDGTLGIKAFGPRYRLTDLRSRLPFQLRDYSAYAQSSGEPFGYTSNINSSIATATQNGMMQFTVSSGTDVTEHDINPMVLWVPLNAVTAYGLSWRIKSTTSSWTLRVYTATGPTGTVNMIQEIDLSGATSGSVSLTGVTGIDDMFLISPYRKTGTGGTTSGDWWLNVTALRVNFLAQSDSATPGQVISAIAARAGFDNAGVGQSSVNCFPFDWQDPGWDGALDYLTTLDDWVWLALEDRGLAEAEAPRGFALDAGSWGYRLPQPWSLGADRNVIDDLDPMVLRNRVIVSYETTAGTPSQYERDANPDPLLNPVTGKTSVSTEYITLQDRQPDSVLAHAVANTQLAYLSGYRRMGKIVVGSLDGADGIASPYALRAGDTVDLRTARPELPSQRVVAASYGPGGSVEADIGRDISPEGLIGVMTLNRERA